MPWSKKDPKTMMESEPFLRRSTGLSQTMNMMKQMMKMPVRKEAPHITEP